MQLPGGWGLPGRAPLCRRSAVSPCGRSGRCRRCRGRRSQRCGHRRRRGRAQAPGPGATGRPPPPGGSGSERVCRAHEVRSRPHHPVWPGVPAPISR
jgi:hypothetical protein